MEKRLKADLNVVANSNLEIQLLDGDLNIIQKLDDEPNDVGGLTSAELKAKFDESGNIIKRYINETLIPAVLTDDATEEARKQAEAARVAAEQGRVTAEKGREAAETARDSAEIARQSAETARSGAESTRQSKENARQTAETARANAETDRQAAETRRGEAETARVSAESERRNAESSRVTAEGGRASTEASRVTAEQGRTSAESTRVQNEQKRVSAENSRVEAETQRAAAEQARADENTGIVAQATARANAAAGSAESASASAKTAQIASSNAGTAASTASSAASTASTAAEAASGSASQASAAATAAAGSAVGAEAASKTAKSWAVGGTGTRPGEDTDNAKYWAEQAQAVVGGDFATKNEAQGYVTAHNQSDDAHSDIREAVSKAGKAFVITGTLANNTVSGVTVTKAEIQAAIAAGKAVVAKLTEGKSIYELPLVSHSQSMCRFGGNYGDFCLVFVISYTESGLEFDFVKYNFVSVESYEILSDDVNIQRQSLATHVKDTSIHVTAAQKTAWDGKAAKALSFTVTLTAAGWNSSTKKQTVTVPGVLADTSKQVIWVTQTTEAAIDAYLEAGIVPVAQAANAVTLRADTVPTADITVNIVVQEVQ